MNEGKPETTAQRRGRIAGIALAATIVIMLAYVGVDWVTGDFGQSSTYGATIAAVAIMTFIAYYLGRNDGENHRR